MEKIVFNFTEEYFQDIKADLDNPDYGIADRMIRVSMYHQGQGVTPNIKLVHVIATHVRLGLDTSAHGEGPSRQVVELDRYMGEYWGLGRDEDSKIIDRAEAEAEIIKSRAEELHLEIRAGKITTGEE